MKVKRIKRIFCSPVASGTAGYIWYGAPMPCEYREEELWYFIHKIVDAIKDGAMTLDYAVKLVEERVLEDDETKKKIISEIKRLVQT